MKPSNTIVYQEEGPYVIIRPQRTITAKGSFCQAANRKTFFIPSNERSFGENYNF